MKLPFDKIYCLHMAENEIRYQNMMSEFEHLGIKDQVEIWWTCKRKISTEIGNSLESLHTIFYNYKRRKNEDVYGAVFNCSFEHYTIIKQAYLRGLNSILILEDDISFNKNISNEKIHDIFANIPEDYDIVKFYNEQIDKDESDNQFSFISNKSIHVYNYSLSSLCYALSNNGMKKYIEKMDEKFEIADRILDTLKCDKEIKFYTLSNNLLCDTMDMNHKNSTILYNITH